MTYRDDLAEVRRQMKVAVEWQNFEEAGRLRSEEKRLEREALADRQWAQEHGEEVT